MSKITNIARALARVINGEVRENHPSEFGPGTTTIGIYGREGLAAEVHGSGTPGDSFTLQVYVGPDADRIADESCGTRRYPKESGFMRMFSWDRRDSILLDLPAATALAAGL